MRYLFRGLIRDSGGPVEGHVEAPNEEGAYDVLGETGVVTESLTPDPKPLNLAEELPGSPEFADALESAFDSSSSQVEFDALTQRYHGKKVWVIDRDKIRRRVAQVVDAALALAQQHGEEHGKVRERVQTALTAMFADNRNLASERNAESVAGMKLGAGDSVAGFRLNTPAGQTVGASPVRPVSFTNVGVPMAPPSSGGVPGMSIAGHAGLEGQIGRLANLVKQAEATLTTIAAAARRVGEGGGGGGGPRRRAVQPAGKGQEQNSVLLEIFKSNLELVRGMQDPTGANAAAAAAASAESASAETASVEERVSTESGAESASPEPGEASEAPGDALPVTETEASPGDGGHLPGDAQGDSVSGGGEPGEASEGDFRASDNSGGTVDTGDTGGPDDDLPPGAEDIPEPPRKP